MATSALDVHGPELALVIVRVRVHAPDGAGLEEAVTERSEDNPARG
jgi:hypothetical protein